MPKVARRIIGYVERIHGFFLLPPPNKRPHRRVAQQRSSAADYALPPLPIVQYPRLRYRVECDSNDGHRNKGVTNRARAQQPRGEYLYASGHGRGNNSPNVGAARHMDTTAKKEPYRLLPRGKPHTAPLQPYIALFAPSLHATLLLQKSARSELLNPLFGISARCLDIDFVTSDKPFCHLIDCKIEPCELFPKVERCGIQCYNTGHIDPMATGHNDNMFTGHLAHLVLFCNLHTAQKYNIFFNLPSP